MSIGWNVGPLPVLTKRPREGAKAPDRDVRSGAPVFRIDLRVLPAAITCPSRPACGPSAHSATGRCPRPCSSCRMATTAGLALQDFLVMDVLLEKRVKKFDHGLHGLHGFGVERRGAENAEGIPLSCLCSSPASLSESVSSVKSVVVFSASTTHVAADSVHKKRAPAVATRMAHGRPPEPFAIRFQHFLRPGQVFWLSDRPPLGPSLPPYGRKVAGPSPSQKRPRSQRRDRHGLGFPNADHRAWDPAPCSGMPKSLGMIASESAASRAKVLESAEKSHHQGHKDHEDKPKHRKPNDLYRLLFVAFVALVVNSFGSYNGSMDLPVEQLAHSPVEGLYVHVPFCRKRCDYCDFYSMVLDPARAAEFVDAAIAELAFWKERLDWSAARTIFIGGGTPTALPAEALNRLLEAVGRAVPEVSEFTIEANPATVDAELARRLRQHGVNRISLGVQSFDAGELETLGRIHSPAEAAESVRVARAAGFGNINLDLIYGIPGQTLDSWQAQPGSGRSVGRRASVVLRPDLRTGHAIRSTARRGPCPATGRRDDRGDVSAGRLGAGSGRF